MKSIDLFVERIVEYINNHIVGIDSTKIMKCNQLNEKLPRGRAIQMDIIVPETIALKDGEHMGPVYYVEELMREFPDSTPEAVAEVLNIRVTEMYDTFMELAHVQTNKFGQTIDTYGPKEIILSVIPACECDNQMEKFCIKKDDDLGLVKMLKAKIGDCGTDAAYYVPIDRGETEPNEKYWEIAAANSLMQTDIDIRISPGEIPFAGIIEDKHLFYDFFYLVEIEPVWGGVRAFGPDRVYIIPNGPYQAVFILESSATRCHSSTSAQMDKLLEKAKKDLTDKPLPVFILDVKSMSISRME